MWTYVLRKLDGTAINEVRQATERSVSLALNKPSTASFTIRPNNPILTPLFAEDTLLQVWEDDTLRFYGNVVSSEFATEDTGEKPTIKVNAANPAWKLSRRLLGLSKGGTAFSGDKAKSARKMINELNTNTVIYPTNPETGIKLLAESEYAAGGSGNYTAGPYKSALGAINDLAHGFDGFDWYIAPLYNEEPKIGVFEADATFGSERKAAFEYGFGAHNVRKINYVRDIGTLCNKAFHLPDEGLDAEGAVVKEAANATSLTLRGRYEEVVDGFGLTDATLRQKWVDEVIRVRSNPRFVAGMTMDIDGSGKGWTSEKRIPQLGVDFWLGDIVTARAVSEGNTIFNGKVRVYQVNISLSTSGTATMEPILIDEEGSEL